MLVLVPTDCIRDGSWWGTERRAIFQTDGIKIHKKFCRDPHVKARIIVYAWQ